MMENLQKVHAIKDDSGHWYVIPAETQNEFRTLLEMSEDYSDERAMEQAEIEFNDKFSKYRTGGDLNLVQLYAEVK